MSATLVRFIVAEFVVLVALVLHLYPWRKLEIALLALLGFGTAVFILRRYRARLTHGAWLALATAGALAITAVIARQYVTTRADNLPALAATRIRPASTGSRSIVRPYPADDDRHTGVQPPTTRWRALKGETPNATFARHAMFAMDGLLSAHAQTGDTAALLAARDLALDWIRQNSTWILRPPSEFSWGDHSTALRLTRFLQLWALWRPSPLATPGEAALLERSILAHGARLAEPAFYTARHNHGIDQDIALGQLALMTDGPIAASWLETSSRRLRRTLDDLLGPGAMTREHSPGYALAMLQHLSAYSSHLRAADEPTDAGHLDEVTGRMREALAWFVEPSGLLVPFGDTHGNVRPPQSVGLAPSRAGIGVFLEDGYAFLHEPYGPDSSPLYLAVTAASNPRFAHKHCDDLSFVLSLGSRRLLVDPGAYSYTADEWRRYFLSCGAHNTASLPGSFQDGTYFAVGTGSARLERVEDRHGFVIVTGTRMLGSGRHDRALIWIREHGLVVVDHVTGVTDTVGLTFHLDAGLRAEAADRGVAVIRGEGGPALMEARTRPSRSWKVTRGATAPIQGWISTAPDHREPADALLLSAAGPVAAFVTEFILSGDARLASRPSAIDTVETSDAGTAVTFRARSATWRVRLGLPQGVAALDSISSRPR